MLYQALDGHFIDEVEFQDLREERENLAREAQVKKKLKEYLKKTVTAMKSNE